MRKTALTEKEDELMIVVNALGEQCPIPVVKATRALREMREPGTLEILVDNETAVQNLLRMASGRNFGSIIFLMGLAPNVLGYRHPAAILDRSKNKCCGLITDGEELKNNQLCFSVDTTVLHLFSDLSRTCPHTSGGWVPPLALTPKNNRSVSFLVA